MTVSASDVKALREKTGLPLMDCKKALGETGGDMQAAIEWLRKNGATVAAKRSDRATEFGRVGLYLGPKVGATADELLDQASPLHAGQTLRDVKDDLFNRIREVFNIERLVRYDAGCGGYEHYGARVHGVLLEAEGGSPELLRDICMHIAALGPQALSIEELDPAVVEKEKSILRDQALAEGKPANIVDKMVEGRMRNFYAESVLLEQPFVKAEDGKETVGAFAKRNGIKIKRFTHWVIGG